MRRLVDTKCFFAVLQFKYKKSGKPWSQEEIQVGLNQKWMPGYDWYRGPKERHIINHEIGLNKLYRFILKTCEGAFIKAQIRSCYMQDSGDDILIAEWIHDTFQVKTKEPRYKPVFVKGDKPDDFVIHHFIEIKPVENMPISDPINNFTELEDKTAELVEKYTV